MATRVASLYAELKADTTQLEARLNAVEGRLNKTDKQAKTLKTSLKAVGGALAGAGIAIGTFRKALDLAQQGAEMERVREKFDRLAATYGTTGEALQTKLRPAMQGLVSDQEAIASVTDIMSLHLVNSEKDVLRLANASSQLGFDMNQLVLTLSNKTTMRFDALGLKVAGFKERLDALKASGMSANDAFTEAFLQQAEEQMKTLGNTADSDVAVFMRFEAEVKNMEDGIKLFLARGLTPWLKLITTDFPVAFATFSAFMRVGIDDIARYGSFANAVRHNMEGFNQAIKAQADAAALAEEANKNVAGEYHGIAKAVGGATDELTGLTAEQLIAKAYEAKLAGNHDLEQNYLDQARSILRATDQLQAYIQWAKIASQVNFTWGGGNSDRGASQFSPSPPGGGAGWGAWQKDALGRNYRYNSTTGEYQTGYQHGGSMVVPPGFPNDTFNIGVSSGEHVAVTPAAEAGSGGGGGMTVNINGPLLIQANNPRQLGDQLGLLARRT